MVQKEQKIYEDSVSSFSYITFLSKSRTAEADINKFHKVWYFNADWSPLYHIVTADRLTANNIVSLACNKWCKIHTLPSLLYANWTSCTTSNTTVVC